MLWHSPTISKSEFEAQTGWQFKPEGACKGEVCIPLNPAPGEQLELAVIAEQMGMPLVADTEHKLWALGPESVGSRALVTAQAPPLTLPDLEGKPFDLASLRGQKVLVYAWAPY